MIRFKTLRSFALAFGLALALSPLAFGQGSNQTSNAPADATRARSVSSGEHMKIKGVVVHRDPDLWPDPLRFDPLRFEAARKASRHRFAYFPFGGGPRVCIGDGFAWLSASLLIATIAQRWRLELVPGQRTAPLPRVTLRLRNGLKLIARARC